MTKLTTVIALVLTLTQMSCASLSAADQEAVSAMNDTVTVLMAARTIEPGEELTEDMVTTRQIPTSFLPKGPLFAGDLEEWLGMPIMLPVEEGRLLEGRDFEGVECTAPAGFVAPRAPSVKSAHATKTSPSGKAKITILAHEENAFLGILQMDADAAVPAHRDETEEYIYVLEGAGTVTIDGTEHAVAPGAVIYMPANAEVSFANSATPLKAIQVFAGPTPAKKYEAWTLEPAPAETPSTEAAPK